jgi:hypothetical protein
MEKRAQIKIFENISVLLMFTIIVIIGIVLYFTFSSSDLEKSRQELESQNAIELASKIALLPELQCRKNNAQEDHCLDKQKIASLGSLITQPSIQDDYFELFGFSTIRIKLYTITSSNILSSTITLYDFKNPNYNSQDLFRIPVSIFDPIYNKYDYGVLETTVYS